MTVLAYYGTFNMHILINLNVLAPGTIFICIIVGRI